MVIVNFPVKLPHPGVSYLELEDVLGSAGVSFELEAPDTYYENPK